MGKVVIDLKAGTISQSGTVGNIVSWDVWWRTIRGLHTTLAEALTNAEETDMPPEMIRAVVVAVDEFGRFEERP